MQLLIIEDYIFSNQLASDCVFEIVCASFTAFDIGEKNSGMMTKIKIERRKMSCLAQ
jgi:hypothetical protein